MHASTLAFRPFQDPDERRVIELLSIGRPGGYAVRKAAIFDWQFRCNPDAASTAPFLIGELDGQIVALNGVMPVRVLFHGRRVRACWSCDTYVSPEYRGRGFGKALVSRISQAAPILLGYGISDMSDPIFDKHGWLLHRGIELLFFHASEHGLRGRLKNLLSRVARARRLRLRSTTCDATTAPTHRLYGEIDELWHRSSPGYVSAVERDSTYLRWKYFQHPIHQYLCYSLETLRSLQAVMIARHDPDESVIVDYCGPAGDVETMIDLASGVVSDLVDRGTTRIRCETTHAPMQSALKQVGFVKSRHASRFRVFAHDDGDPLADWFLMPGDSDGDVLSASELGPL